MKPTGVVVALVTLVMAWGVRAEEPAAVPLPEGVKVGWDPDRAHRETTATREKICLNGLWRWQPAEAESKAVPGGGWGYFKVPGCWPGITDYMQKDSQRVFAHPQWKDWDPGLLSSAWYEREITVPPGWVGRQIAVTFDTLNSRAVVFVDGKAAGEARFPAGEVDLSLCCRPGARHVLSVRVDALPMKAVMLSFTDSAAAREVAGSVPRRGLCGDVFLVSRPAGPRFGDVWVDTSVRKQEITIGAALEGLRGGAPHRLRARVTEAGRIVREFTSRPFEAGETGPRRFGFTESWKPGALWDTHTPQNVYGLEVALLDGSGTVTDAQWPVRFGFREFWVDGRDFMLNNSRIHLSAVPLDNAQIGAGLATRAAARESFERLKGFGINFVYTHNYDCEPGSHLSFEGILEAADEAGMLVALTQPHFSGYDWKTPGLDESNGYAEHAAAYVRVARRHPSVVMYAMSHNATGYEEDMNPDLIDGVHAPRDTWSSNNATLALRAEAIVQRLDPGRIIYHHASGNLGSLHAINFYPNMVPVQELSDWFAHWAAEGVKPVFLCEYGAPFTWDWTMYRGWFKGEREFGSAKVPWEFCLAEWNAQFFGDRAFALSEAEKANLRWEAKQFRAGNLWHRWDYPNAVGSERFDERFPVFARYISDNWRAFRTWGVSATSPWEFGHFWKRRGGVPTQREELPVDWADLQKPGFSPDFNDGRLERMDVAFRRDEWAATPAADALMRNNQPLLAYIGGKPAAFTSKDHAFGAGETVEKQMIVINDSRVPVTCDCQWSVGLPEPAAGARTMVTVAPGAQARLPLRFELPAAVAPGTYDVRASFAFSDGRTQTDSFAIQVMPPARPIATAATTAVFDPKGETRALLDTLGVRATTVEAGTDLAGFDILVVGKGALSPDGPALDLSRVRDGLKVIAFEQSPAVLEKRFGFRVVEYGLREVFARLPDHPVLTGLGAETLRDWRGEATILPSRLTYEVRPRFGPTVRWCGLPVPRLWRCGNRGNVASVLIERPARGDFLSILDGGFGLEFSALLEFREGRGLVVFCQVDVTGRTESDPAAALLARNLFDHVSRWKPGPRRKARYAGEAAGSSHLEAAGVTAGEYDGGRIEPDEVLVAGPGAGLSIGRHAASIAAWLREGGRLVAIGIDQADADALLPAKVTMKVAEHIASSFPPAGLSSPLAGVGPADVHNHDPRELALVSGGADVLGDGVLATTSGPNVVFVQLAPWQFADDRQSNLRRTHRRASVLVSRILANLGVEASTPLLDRFLHPIDAATEESRWLSGLYLHTPTEWDDPYRFFRW